MSGLIIAAPSSGSGKTTVTLGMLRALSQRGLALRPAKSGPDYIDPRFHEAASGVQCVNLDAWAMSADRIRTLAAGPGTLIVEGAMGLFDGAPPDNRGATADLARILGLPVVLVIDAARMAGSVAALFNGFVCFDATVNVAGVILNNVGSARHETMLRRALAPYDVPVFGAIRRSPGLSHPSRHLGLVQASERTDLDDFLNVAADLMRESLDLDALLGLADRAPPIVASIAAHSRPPAQRIAIAQDAAFTFVYPHIIADWRAAGAEIGFFSPLADDPAPTADLIYLSGGYPELHAGRLAHNDRFLNSLRIALQNTDIYGECGGYMVMGDALTDAGGTAHRMAGLLRLETSFANRHLHLGYRHVQAPGTRFAGNWTAHEFHYATTISASGDPLFSAQDAEGTTLPPMGLNAGRAFGSFAHLIDRA